MIESTERTINSYKNPYMQIYFWIKSEMMDLNAIQNWLQERNRLLDAKQKLETKQRNNESRLNVLETGKKSIRNLFKSKSSKENEADTLRHLIDIESTEIISYMKIINIITQYIAEKAIPFFKKDKMNNYYNMLDIMWSQEQTNVNISTTYWTMLQGQVAYSQY